MALKTLDALDVQDKRVLVHDDFDVPLREVATTDDSQIQATLPTLHKLLGGGATLFSKRIDVGCMPVRPNLAPMDDSDELFIFRHSEQRIRK